MSYNTIIIIIIIVIILIIIIFGNINNVEHFSSRSSSRSGSGSGSGSFGSRSSFGQINNLQAQIPAQTLDQKAAQQAFTAATGKPAQPPISAANQAIAQKISGGTDDMIAALKQKDQEEIYSTYPALIQQDNGTTNSLADINAYIPDQLTDCVNDIVGYRMDIASLKMERTQLQNEVDMFRNLINEQDAKNIDLTKQITELQNQNTIARQIIDSKDQQIERLTVLNEYANYKNNKCIELTKNNITS